MFVDFHTHIFPDAIAKNAIPALETKSGVKAALDGTLADLLGSMKRNTIGQSVVCSIATSPEQFQPILEWSQQVASQQIIPLPSVHPESAQVQQELQTIFDGGFKGIKLHPYYQDFFLDEKRLLPLFEKTAELGLFVVMHCGYDIGFPEEERANPAQIKTLLHAVPGLKLVAAHLGAWKQWQEVADYLVGEDVYLDLAFVLDFIDRELAVDIIKSHPHDRILFGSDSPWEDQSTAIMKVRKLQLGAELERLIFSKNGHGLLDL